MNKEKLIIREMKEGEEREIVKTGRRAFPAFEALFVESPRMTMAAVYEDKIIGGIIYKFISSGGKRIAYISEAFVDPDYHGSGVGTKLYKETFCYIWDQGCDGMTALVKDDNVASWKLFMENGFKRVGAFEVIRQAGISGALLQYLKTPVPFAVGMDFYMVMKETSVKEKDTGVCQLFSFLASNFLLLLPVWLQLFRRSPQSLPVFMSAYFTVLTLFVLTRYAGTLFSRRSWKFRFNNGGSFLTVLLGLFGNTFPMNGNWYPDKYENTPDFRRDMAIPEIIKWAVFSLAALLAFTGIPYLRSVSQIICYYLIFIIIPLYPFEALGAGRIYRFSRLLWLFTAVLTVLELTLVFHFAG